MIDFADFSERILDIASADSRWCTRENKLYYHIEIV